MSRLVPVRHTAQVTRTLRTAGLLAVLLALVAVWHPVGASAPRTASRGVTLTYSQPGGLAPVLSGSSTLLSPGAWQRVGATEDRVRVAGRDAGGKPIAVSLDYQPTATSGTETLLVCGTSSYLPVARGSELRVTPVVGRCTDGSVSLTTSGHITLTFLRPLPPPSNIIPARDRWAVVVGIAKYAGRTHPTVGGVGDADHVRAALLTAGWYSDHILVLKDSQASGQAIINAMAWLAERSGPKTYTLFHFSGHACIASRGPCASGHTYLWGADNRFVSEDSVTRVLGRVQGHAWFDFAACESGAFDNGLSSNLRLVTAASQANETAYEQPKWSQSIWTGLVFDQAFLQGYAGPQRHRATIAQMVAYGTAEAPRLTAHADRGPQHPYARGGDAKQNLFAPHL